MLAATRNLNRLEGVGETLRAVLNALAMVAPDWLLPLVPDEWFDRYERAVDEYRLPKGIAARKEYAPNHWERWDAAIDHSVRR
ncbi:MAG: hypothetical protein DSM106950_00655 [Stigonema ocellatum SAG 48.90 = DSM 106950]|nr:hypothetical protein [Stigonema ocellatum SAG 48.90 = DSM 106950]